MSLHGASVQDLIELSSRSEEKRDFSGLESMVACRSRMRPASKKQKL
jgi:hypothetical protein